MRSVWLLMIVVGCGAPSAPTGAHARCPSGTTLHERGQERWCEDAAGEWHGPYERLDASGAVVESGRYRHGVKAGAWAVPVREPSQDEERRMGEPAPDAASYTLPEGAQATVGADGVRTVTRSGVRIAEGRFLLDVPVGVHRTWSDDGTLRSEVPYDSEGRPDGTGMVDGERVTWDRGERVTPP